MRILIGLLKFILGVSLAIAILGASGFYGARYVMTRLTAPPERPLFPEEGGTPLENGTTDAIEPSSDSADQGSEETAASAEENSPVVEAEPELEPGDYEARVIQPIGLILRQGPDVSTTQLGGIAYNEVVIVLDDNSEQRWMKIRLPDSNVEGWVKSGNTEKIN